MSYGIEKGDLTVHSYMKDRHTSRRLIKRAVRELDIQLPIAKVHVDAEIISEDNQLKIDNHLGHVPPKKVPEYLEAGFVPSNKLSAVLGVSVNRPYAFLRVICPDWKKNSPSFLDDESGQRIKLISPEVVRDLIRYRDLSPERQQLAHWRELRGRRSNFYRKTDAFSVLHEEDMSIIVNDFRENSRHVINEVRSEFQELSKNEKQLILQSINTIYQGRISLNILDSSDLIKLKEDDRRMLNEILDTGMFSYLVLSSVKPIFSAKYLHSAKSFTEGFFFLNGEVENLIKASKFNVIIFRGVMLERIRYFLFGN